MTKKKVDSNWPHKLYAHPHDGVTDIYRDREMTKFVATDPWMQYRKSKARIFNNFWFWVEIIK